MSKTERKVPKFKVFLRGEFVGEMDPVQLMKFRAENDTASMQVMSNTGKWMFEE